jgi:hypothetical protein
MIQEHKYKHAQGLSQIQVVEYITLMVSMSEHRQGFLDLKLRDRLSVADAIILHQRLGVTKAANFVDVVAPGDDDTPSTIVVKPYLHSLVDKAASAKISDKTEASITEFLLSPLLMKKSGRPSNLSSKQRSKEVPHLKDRFSLQLQPLRGNQALNLSIFQLLKVFTFRTFASPPPLTTFFFFFFISLLSMLIKHSPLLGGIHK